MKPLHALTAGLAGAVVLTVTHQLLHKISNKAPRMDLMGEEALLKISNKADLSIPADKLYNTTMAGDIIGNAIYYAIGTAGKPKHATVRGTLFGLAAGIGGVILPKHIGLTNAYSNRTFITRLLTIAIYTLGGMVSGKVASKFKERI